MDQRGGLAPRIPVFARYVFACLLTGAALVLALSLRHYSTLPPLFLFLSVIGSSWLFGLGPSLLSALLSVATLNHFFVPPLHERLSLDAPELVEFLIFLAVAAGMSKLVTDRHKAEIALREANARLESRVEERTRELATANESLQREIQTRARAEEELMRSNADLETFAYSASHDLQEPLRTIHAYAELLQRRYGERLDEQGHEFLGNVLAGTDRLLLLIRDLLEFSRLGSEQLSKEPLDMSEVLRAAEQACKVMMDERDAIVEAADLPSLSGDAGQLSLLLQNLITNALKFQRLGVHPVIRIEARRQGTEWMFRVSDNGIGIAPENLERIFVVFKRLHHRSQYPGTGIGLALCRRVVERHGGRIWAESEVGKGTTFTFTLPADLEDREAVPSTVAAAGIPRRHE